MSSIMYTFDVYLFGILRHFQHCTGHITTGSWKGRGNQYIQLVKVLYCKLPTNGKQLSAFPLEVRPGTEPQSQRWEVRVLPVYHRGPTFDMVLHSKSFTECQTYSTLPNLVKFKILLIIGPRELEYITNLIVRFLVYC